MKKVILLLSLFLISTIIVAQDVLTLFQYTDSLNFQNALYLPDGVTPIPDEFLVEICIPTNPKVKDYTKDPHGDQLNNNFVSFKINGSIDIGFTGFFIALIFFNWEDSLGSPEEPVANCEENIYLRIYNAPTIDSATYYMNSAFIEGPSAGSLTSEYEISKWDTWAPISKSKPESTD